MSRIQRHCYNKGLTNGIENGLVPVPGIGSENFAQFCSACEKEHFFGKDGSDTFLDFLTCTECLRSFNAACLKLTETLVENCKTYDWQCGACKLCQTCKLPGDEAKVLLCDACDRGFHMYCLEPPVKSRPRGDWIGPCCTVSTQLDPSIGSSAKHISSIKEDSVASATRNRKRKSAVVASLKLSPKFSKVKPSPKAWNCKKNASSKVNGELVSRFDEFPIPDKCPTVGCNGDGHLSGKFERHRTRQTCPLYHNLSAAECKDLADTRDKWVRPSADERPARRINGPARRFIDSDSVNWECDRDRINTDLRSRRALKSELLKRHRETHGRNREPLLDGLSTQKDLDMFRQAQSLLAQDLEEHPSMLQEHQLADRSRWIRWGNWEIAAWYHSPYPDGLDKMYRISICEQCFAFVSLETQLWHHVPHCSYRERPPGTRIYCDGKLAFWEIDGQKYTEYCQSLCLFAKLFLDHKTLYFDVEPFLFYLMTSSEGVEKEPEAAYYPIGYFSKEKRSLMNCNLSCILTFPPYMRKGYGRLLIDFSYMLSRVENNIGSPERPLSDLGLISYRNYWKGKILEYLAELKPRCVSVKDISTSTCIHQNDIISTLQYMGMIKYWKGDYWIDRRESDIKEHLRKHDSRKPRLSLKPKYLKWTPHPETV